MTTNDKERNDPAIMALGKRIRSLREASGHSQEGFARLAQIDRAYYGAIERGKMNISFLKLVQIAKALDTKVQELIPSDI
jgi:transcriptional regulator with XRE-family HTH domain